MSPARSTIIINLASPLSSLGRHVCAASVIPRETSSCYLWTSPDTKRRTPRGLHDLTYSRRLPYDALSNFNYNENIKNNDKDVAAAICGGCTGLSMKPAFSLDARTGPQLRGGAAGRVDSRYTAATSGAERTLFVAGGTVSPPLLC